MTRYSRRGACLGASGIGRWLEIMEIISYLTIVVNVCIIYFTGNSTLIKVGSSSFVEFMVYMNKEKWTTSNIILLAVLLEHVLFLLKLAIAAGIPDVPTSVIKAEAKRSKIEDRAKKFITNVIEEHKKHLKEQEQ
jgi:hypothetical protein